MPVPPPSPLPRIRPATLDPAAGYDPRLTPWRPDLADVALAGRFGAQHFVHPVTTAVAASLATLHREPSATSEALSQLIFGELFDVLERGPEWCWGRCVADSYVGYVRRDALDTSPPEPATHRLRAAAAHLFSGPSIKSAVLKPLYRGAQLRVRSVEDKFAQLAGGGHVRASLIAPVQSMEEDWVQLAGDLLETPYLWGGRSRAGIDCSGLVQVSLQACGIAAPRDSDMQMALGEDIGALVATNGLRRGDLIFFPGHVGIMADAAHLLHANAYHMKTVVEPLADVVARLLPDHHRPITGARRVIR